MEIEINDKTARAMAGRLRNAVGNISHSKALETLAVTLGYKNWDTLAGVLKKAGSPAASPLALDKTVPIYLHASATSEWGEAPDFCKLELTNQFLEHLARQRALCVEHGLSETRTDYDPQWGPEDGGIDPFRIHYSELVVTHRDFWFIGYPKHANDTIESRAVEIDLLLQTLSSGKAVQDYLVWHEGCLVHSPIGEPQSTIDELMELGELSSDSPDESL